MTKRKKKHPTFRCVDDEHRHAQASQKQSSKDSLLSLCNMEVRNPYPDSQTRMRIECKQIYLRD